MGSKFFMQSEEGVEPERVDALNKQLIIVCSGNREEAMLRAGSLQTKFADGDSLRR